MISGWKKAAIENMASAFDGKMPAEPSISEKEVEKRPHYAMICRRRPGPMTLKTRT